MSSEKVHSSYGALGALSSSLLQFRSDFEASTRDVERSLQSSAHDADGAVATRRRDLDTAVADRVRAQGVVNSAKAELSAAESELDWALEEDPRYRGSSVSQARARVTQAQSEVGRASAALLEAERWEHEKRRLLERSENARRKIHSTLDDYRSSVSAARAAETAIAMAALAKLSILKRILSTYLNSSSLGSSAGGAFRSAARGTGAGGGTASGGGSGPVSGSASVDTDSTKSAGEDRPIDWAALSLQPESAEVQLAVLGPQLRRLLGLDACESTMVSGREHEIWAERWVNGGAAMFRRDPTQGNFSARDLREGLSGADSFGAMYAHVRDEPVALDPVTGRLLSGEGFLNALVAAGAEVVPLRFEGGPDVD